MILPLAPAGGIKDKDKEIVAPGAAFKGKTIKKKREREREETTPRRLQG